MKRVLAVLSALCLLITFLPTVVIAETYESLTYSVSDGKVTITDCADSVTGVLEIPATIDGYPVTTIGISAFAGCIGLTAVTAGENVTTIGDRAFEGCTQLASVTVGQKVTNLESTAFSGCTALAALTVAAGNPVYHSAGNCVIETSSKTLVLGCKESLVPADGTVTAIGPLAFYNCDGLTAITIPDSVQSIGASAFEGCTRLETVAMGSGVAAIGNSAFLGCTALTDVVIPDSVTSMGIYAFSGCTKLASVDIGDQVSVIGNSAFSGCTALTDVTIGAGVVTIDLFAFSGCTQLAELVIPQGVTTIGVFAFYNCAALETVEIPASVTAIGNNAFAGCVEVTLSIDEENTYAVSYAQNKGITYMTTGLGSLEVTTVTLRPGAAGVYFSSNLDWAGRNSQVQSYGFAVSTVNPLPVADDSDESSLYTVGNKSALVSDILETVNGDAVNAENAKMVIYARAYAQKTDGTYVYSDAVQVTLKQVVIGAQSRWEELTTVQKEALQQMYTTYETVMSSWDVPNLKTA